jgi:hypothetical protein
MGGEKTGGDAIFVVFSNLSFRFASNLLSAGREAARRQNETIWRDITHGNDH